MTVRTAAKWTAIACSGSTGNRFQVFLHILYVQGSLGWRLLFGVAVLPAAAVLVVVPWLYETPHR
jgi:hypothetical protein